MTSSSDSLPSVFSEALEADEVVGADRLNSPALGVFTGVLGWLASCAFFSISRKSSNVIVTTLSVGVSPLLGTSVDGLAASTTDFLSNSNSDLRASLSSRASFALSFAFLAALFFFFFAFFFPFFFFLYSSESSEESDESESESDDEDEEDDRPFLSFFATFFVSFAVFLCSSRFASFLAVDLRARVSSAVNPGAPCRVVVVIPLGARSFLLLYHQRRGRRSLRVAGMSLVLSLLRLHVDEAPW